MQEGYRLIVQTRNTIYGQALQGSLYHTGISGINMIFVCKMSHFF